jgi:uncharacterized membrane protein YfcA
MTALLLAAMGLAGAAQRTTGMGFALVAAPLLVLALGPWDGVTVSTVAGSAICATMLWACRGDIQWSRVTRLTIASAVAVLPGTWIALVTPTRWLQLGIGVLLLVGLTVTVVMAPRSEMDGPGLAWSTGFASGLMGALAGVAGPAMTVYGRLSGLGQTQFVATIQPMFLVMGIVSLAVRWAIKGNLWPTAMSGYLLAACVSAVALGVLAGNALSKVLTDKHARIGTLLIAYLGSLAAVVDSLRP